MTEGSGLDYRGPTYTAASADYDRDGWPDLAVSNHGRIALFHNKRDGTFREVTAIGNFEQGDTHGISWVDIDGDSWPDLYVSRGAFRGRRDWPNRLHLNREGRRFEMADLPSDAVIANGTGRGRSSTPVDINGDSRIDLIITNLHDVGRPQRVAVQQDGGFVDRAAEIGWSSIQAQTVTALTLNAGAGEYLIAHGDPRAAGRLFRFSESGSITDVSHELGIDLQRRFVGFVAPGDFDNDGDLDLYYVSTSGWSQQQGPYLQARTISFAYEMARSPSTRREFRFAGAGRFQVEIWGENRSTPSLLKIGAAKTEAAELPWQGEVLDERLLGEPQIDPTRDYGVFLWRQAGELVLRVVGRTGTLESATGRVRFEAGTPRMGEEWGSTRESRDTGNLLFENRGGSFVDVTESAGVGDPGPGTDAVFADLDNDGDVDLYVVNGGLLHSNPPNVLYENLGDGTFVEIAESAGAVGLAGGRGTSVLAFDYDRDGDLDLFLTNGHGPPPRNAEGRYQLLRNDSNSGGWLSVAPYATVSNPMALGTRVRVRVGDSVLLQELHAATGAFSTSWLPLHFGVGSAASVAVSIEWPSGKTQALQAKANAVLTPMEPR